MELIHCSSMSQDFSKCAIAPFGPNNKPLCICLRPDFDHAIPGTPNTRPLKAKGKSPPGTRAGHTGLAPLKKMAQPAGARSRCPSRSSNNTRPPTPAQIVARPVRWRRQRLPRLPTRTPSHQHRRMTAQHCCDYLDRPPGNLRLNHVPRRCPALRHVKREQFA